MGNDELLYMLRDVCVYRSEIDFGGKIIEICEVLFVYKWIFFKDCMILFLLIVVGVVIVSGIVIFGFSLWIFFVWLLIGGLFLYFVYLMVLKLVRKYVVIIEILIGVFWIVKDLDGECIDEFILLV